jgi:hypothetical protein
MHLKVPSYFSSLSQMYLRQQWNMGERGKSLGPGRILPAAPDAHTGHLCSLVGSLHPCWDDAPRKHSLSPGRLSVVHSWENVAPGLKYLPKQPNTDEGFLTLCSLRALPALCCQNLGDVPRPGAAHVPANCAQNKPLAGGQEAPSQPPPPSSAFFSPPIQYKIFLPQFP